jgi:hypothetical protein
MRAKWVLVRSQIDWKYLKVGVAMLSESYLKSH